MVTSHTDEIVTGGRKHKVIEQSYICLHFILQNIVLVFLGVSEFKKTHY